MTMPDVRTLLPHSGQMVLLHRVVSVDDETLCAEVRLHPGSMLAGDQGVGAWVGIEYMAQAVAAYAGIKSKRAGEPIKPGFLLGTRRYTSNVGSFDVGTTLTIQVKNIIQDDKLSVFDCKIQGAGIEISANLNVYQPSIESRQETNP